jgi:hypothetical protein
MALSRLIWRATATQRRKALAEVGPFLKRIETRLRAGDGFKDSWDAALAETKALRVLVRSAEAALAAGVPLARVVRLVAADIASDRQFLHLLRGILLERERDRPTDEQRGQLPNSEPAGTSRHGRPTPG